MSGFKHLLPSSTFRAAVCVSVAVGASLSGLGDEVVGCLAGLARVPAGVAVTNRFVPFRPDFASIFAVQMDGGTNRLDSDMVAWCPVGGEPVAFWKLELPGHGLDGWLVVGASPDGDPTPSKADLDFTRRLIELGHLADSPLKDHLVIGDPLHADGYISIRATTDLEF